MLSQAWVMCLFPVASYLTGILVQKVIQPGLMGQEWISQELRSRYILFLPDISCLLLLAHHLILLLYLEDSFFLSFSLLRLKMVAPVPNITRLSGAYHYLWLSSRKRESDWLQGWVFTIGPISYGKGKDYAVQT